MVEKVKLPVPGFDYAETFWKRIEEKSKRHTTGRRSPCDRYDIMQLFLHCVCHDSPWCGTGNTRVSATFDRVEIAFIGKYNKPEEILETTTQHMDDAIGWQIQKLMELLKGKE